MRKVVGLDTNIFIYYFEKHPQFGPLVKKIFESLAAGKTQAVASILTLTELISLPVEIEQIEKLKSLYLEIPGLRTYDVNQTIAVRAAKIRRDYGFRIPDAIQLATSLVRKADLFITNDQRLKSFKEIPIKILSENGEIK